MYNRHQPQIARFAEFSPNHFRRVLLFVLLTIRQRLYNVPAHMDALEREGGEVLGYLYGNKWLAWQYINEHCERLYQESNQIFQGEQDLIADRLLMLFGEIPGIGLIKAGFCAQLLFGVSGCFDVNNAKCFALPDRAFRSDHWKRNKPSTRWRKVHEYNAYVDACGGTSVLWDHWCEFVYERDKPTYDSAEHVSRIHVEATVELGPCK